MAAAVEDVPLESEVIRNADRREASDTCEVHVCCINITLYNNLFTDTFFSLILLRRQRPIKFFPFVNEKKKI